MNRFAGYFVLTIIIAAITESHANGLDPAGFQLALSNGINQSTDLPTVSSAFQTPPPAAVPPRSALEQTFNTGKTLGVIGVTGWATGAIIEFFAMVSFISNPDSDAGNGIFATGLLLELFSPIFSCAGESIAMNAAIGENGNRIDLQKYGWKLYGQSYIWLGLSVGCSFLAFNSDVPMLLTASSLFLVAGMVYRGAASIAPIVNMNRTKKKLNISVAPTIDSHGNVGLALNAVF